MLCRRLRGRSNSRDIYRHGAAAWRLTAASAAMDAGAGTGCICPFSFAPLQPKTPRATSSFSRRDTLAAGKPGFKVVQLSVAVDGQEKEEETFKNGLNISTDLLSGDERTQSIDKRSNFSPWRNKWHLEHPKHQCFLDSAREH